MRFSDVFAASLVAPLVAAHGGDIPGAPKMFGMPKNLRAKNPWTGHHSQTAAAQLRARQGGDENNMCGPQGGGQSCAAGYCCSPAGYCGTTKDHCAAPDCQIDFGPGCDANKTPYGSSTQNDARPQLGSIEYGGWGIRECLKPKTVAITYDDGPYIYTEQVMAQFEARGGRATFFVTGNNIGKGAIDEEWREVIENMYARGHQIASHTWSHQNLDEITSEQRYDQMVKNEMAIRNIIGKYPTYMRPPYSACVTEPCMDDMEKLGYIITSFDLDTDDYNNLTPEKMQKPKDIFKASIEAAGPDGDRLAIAHDIHELTALNLTGYMLETLYDAGFTAVTVGECMNDPVENWYRDSAVDPRPSPTASPSSAVPTPTGPTSTDGRCGAANSGQSCVEFVGPDGISECCSPAGWCGRSADHCGADCNPLFGKCGTQPSISTTPTPSSSGPVPTPTGPTSTDGQCGAANGDQSCIGFVGPDGISECCSPAGWCGRSVDHCGTGCNPLFGKCGTQPPISATPTPSVSQTSSAPVPTVSLSSSVDSKCGAEAGTTCIGFTLEGVKAECCSQYNYCGNTEDHCALVSCNPLYGNCGSSGPSSVVVGSASSSKNQISSVTAILSVPASETLSSASASPSVSDTASSSIPASISLTASQSSIADTSLSPSTSASLSEASVSKAATSSNYPADQPSPISLPSFSFSSIIDESSSTPAVSIPIDQSSSTPDATPTPIPTTLSTVIKPSSTPCDDDNEPAATPTPPVSTNGKCGSANGGQTCAGYKNPFGQSVECCCKESGRCSTDPWSCGVGCDGKFGKCNRY